MIIPSIVVDNHWTRRVIDTCSGSWSANYEAPVPISEDIVVDTGKAEVSSWKSPNLDRALWSEIKRSGKIRMTNYDVGKIGSESFLGEVARSSYYYFEMCTREFPPNSPCTRSNLVLDGRSDWRERGDFTYWKSRYALAPTYSDALVIDQNAVDRALGSCFSNLIVGYDGLTELATAKESLSAMVSILNDVRHPLRAFSDFVRDVRGNSGPNSSKSSAVRTIGKEWLRYRYAIMPLVYSVKDILDTLKNETYLTERARINATIGSGLPSSLPDVYFHEKLTGYAHSSITCKGHWGSGRSSLDRVSINPFLTTWELIPYSFVVDWFINVGDVLTTALSGLTSSGELVGCVATKCNYQVSTMLNYRINETTSFSRSKSRDGNCVPINYNLTRGGIRSGSILLKRESWDTYSRRVKEPSDVKLTFSPFLNWKRTLDGLFLSIGKSSSALRGL